MYKLLLFCSVLFSTCLLHAQEPSHPLVLVSVSPHVYFVERIGGDTVDVKEIVPPGASAHTFEPTPKQMLAAVRASVWFRIGESFEAKVLDVLKVHGNQLQVVDLRQNLNLIHCDQPHACHCHGENFSDLHFWLSPRLAKIQAETIAQALMAKFPAHRDLYQANLTAFLRELDQLDQEIQALSNQTSQRVILVSHPAYAYFCRDYGFEQLSIEFEGKDPTPQQLTRLLAQARANKIKTIFTQMQYSNKGAKLIASYIHANVVELDPYSKDYICSLLTIAKAFTCQ